MLPVLPEQTAVFVAAAVPATEVVCTVIKPETLLVTAGEQVPVTTQ